MSTTPDWRLTVPENVLLALPDLNAVCEDIARTHAHLTVWDCPATGVETWIGWYPSDPSERVAAVKALTPVVDALRHAARPAPVPQTPKETRDG